MLTYCGDDNILSRQYLPSVFSVSSDTFVLPGKSCLGLQLLLKNSLFSNRLPAGMGFDPSLIPGDLTFCLFFKNSVAVLVSLCR